jgi:hypothetical protein
MSPVPQHIGEHGVAVGDEGMVRFGLLQGLVAQGYDNLIGGLNKTIINICGIKTRRGHTRMKRNV